MRCGGDILQTPGDVNLFFFGLFFGVVELASREHYAERRLWKTDG